mmetsp:Transcript_50703/g.100868  ORF Transcript_50703/g.100868 Transcript_50703/m.100868 type:complete len:327 (+) Transcript_50703:758-1738(+)
MRSILRSRSRGPPHFVQASQFSHCPHKQSTQLPLSQCCMSQATSSRRAPLQGFPPGRLGERILRARVFCPPPQVAEQALHSFHVPNWQSFAPVSLQPDGRSSSLLGLQGAYSWSDALTQGLPCNFACCFTWRCRSMMPEQLRVHAPHSPQSDSLQSWSWSHGSECLHSSYCSSKPTAGFPHELCRWAMDLCRQWYPGPQVTVQRDQSSQSVHFPSIHSLQLCVLQLAVSARLSGEHSRPSWLGCCNIERLRRFSPPSHEREHAPQESHSPHRQSWESHSLVMQALTSPKAATQVSPVCCTCLVRVVTPLPHSWEQSSQSVQAESLH